MREFILIFGILGVICSISAIVIEWKRGHDKRIFVLLLSAVAIFVFPLAGFIMLYVANKASKEDNKTVSASSPAEESQSEPDSVAESNGSAFEYEQQAELNQEPVIYEERINAQDIIDKYNSEYGEASFMSDSIVSEIGPVNLALEHHDRFGGPYMKDFFVEELNQPAFKISRSFSAMNKRERAALMLIDVSRLLCNDNSLFFKEKMSIICSSGECEISTLYDLHQGTITETSVLFREWMNSSLSTSSVSVGKVFADLLEYAEGNDSDLADIITSQLKGGNNLFSGKDQVKDIYLAELNSERKSTDLVLGILDGKEVRFNGNGSLITIARQGSGKSQANVILNLLRYSGPSLVIDVKGECYKSTADWRRKNIGPVYRFAPLERDNCDSYNILDFVNNDLEYVWDEAKSLSNNLIPESKSDDPYWDNLAKELIGLAIAYCVLNVEIRNPNMQDVLDVLSSNKSEWEEFIAFCKGERLPVPRAMSRSIKVFEDFEAKQLSSVKSVVMSHLHYWQLPSIEKSTESSDFSHEVFRDGSNSTVYICVPPNKVAEYSNLLRAMLNQLLGGLLEELPDPHQINTLCFLDEFAQLGPMPAIEKTLNLGRQYNVQLWMFVQNTGLLTNVTSDPDNYLESCQVKAFMNPTFQIAKDLSEEIGFTDGIIDGERKPIISPQKLSSEEFEDKIIAISAGVKPIVMDKMFAYKVYPEAQNAKDEEYA
ncbi:type IV secretory system conjugative DNA transfer family protein [Vibrio cidicii]|uniref:type IV secretory system conjugative DNA transfer family protein n=1 Tax=Vibrio cidicii TaxID=1763883 RepID=UPI003F519B22